MAAAGFKLTNDEVLDEAVLVYPITQTPSKELRAAISHLEALNH